MKDFIARVWVLQLVTNLTKEQLWEHLVDSILQQVQMHIRHASTDKDVLDRVPLSIKMFFRTILSAGSRVEFEKTREAYAQGQSWQKVQQGMGSKEEKKENPKAVDEGQKVHSL